MYHSIIILIDRLVHNRTNSTNDVGGEPDLDELIERHGGPAPRYVAYPSPSLWRDPPPSGEHVRRLRTVLKKAEPVALYVHVPFCQRLCHFCSCYTEIRRHLPAHGNDYVSHVKIELERLRVCAGKLPRIFSLHLGGGTPTFLSEKQLVDLLKAIRANAEFCPSAEFSLETNPELVTPSQLRLLWELGFSRISLGVQDLNPNVQWAINRFHPYHKIKDIVTLCRDTGFDSVNFDLVYGLPKQTMTSFSRTVEKVLELGPDRVALYHFAYLPNKKPHQRILDKSAFPTPKENIHIFQAATALFESNGYESVGMDHFAKTDDPLALASRKHRLKRSFMGYEPNPVPNFLGVGPSAISFLDGAYLRNVPSLHAWRHAIDGGRFGQDLWRELTPEDYSRHNLINDLLCNLEIRNRSFARALGPQVQRIFPILEEFVSEGILRRNRKGWEVTKLGRTFVRAIAKTLDAYQIETPKKTQPLSSVNQA